MEVGGGVNKLLKRHVARGNATRENSSHRKIIDELPHSYSTWEIGIVPRLQGEVKDDLHEAHAASAALHQPAHTINGLPKPILKDNSARGKVQLDSENNPEKRKVE